MTILADWQIKQLCVDPFAGRTDVNQFGRPFTPMISPFIEGLKEEGVVSYGLTSKGYDMRAGNAWLVFTDSTQAWRDYASRERKKHPMHYMGVNPPPQKTLTIDPKKPLPEEAFTRHHIPDHEAVIIPPRGYALTHSVEHVRMPAYVVATCLGKSTYARVGLHLNVTPLEPGWEGQVTIELANSTEHAIKVYAGEGIMQVLFDAGERPLTTYADRKGKYQGQTGVTTHKVRGT
jgi:dCTP deaminase